MVQSQSCEVISFNRNRTELPLKVILTNWIDFREISGLPVNADCTPIIEAASERALSRMFPGGRAFVETFMPRHRQFQDYLAEEVAGHAAGMWQPPEARILSQFSAPMPAAPYPAPQPL